MQTRSQKQKMQTSTPPRRRSPAPLHEPQPSRRRRKEKMIHESNCSHADLQALQTHHHPPSPPSPPRRNEKMIHESISSHAGLQALQTRSDELHLNLVSLESVRIAVESYTLLRPLVEVRSWLCPQLDLLSLVAGLALELQKVEHDLLPPLLEQEAKLEGGVLKALLFLENSSLTLSCLGEGIKKLIAELGGSLEEELEEDEFLCRVYEVGVVLQGTADMVLKEHHKISWLQRRIRCALDLVIALLEAPVRFPE